jgi:hypothetical protein
MALSLFGHKLRAAGAAQDGSAQLDNAADVARSKLDDVSGDQTGVAVTDAKHLAVPVEPHPYYPMAAFISGASPPLVNTPMRFIACLTFTYRAAIRSRRSVVPALCLEP